MMAIALVPVTGLAGSAIDTARLYYVKVRLQQACDAGALAGRKFMKGSDFDEIAQNRAKAMFANNFSNGTFGATDVSFTPTQTADGQVRGDASVKVPMTITKMLGAETANLAVMCVAKLEIPNLDIMFVLDTTGSMNETPSGDSQSKIASLRSSVLDFYDSIQSSKQTGTQVRYGFVPYSQTVNVGMLLKREWVADRATYQSRVPDGKEEVDQTTDTPTTTSVVRDWYYVSGSSSSSSWVVYGETCPAYTNTVKTTETVDQTRTETQPDGSVWKYQTRKQVIDGDSYSVTKGSGQCNVTKVTYNKYNRWRDEVVKPGPGKVTTKVSRYWWMYRPVEFDVSGFKGNNPSGLMAGGEFGYTVGNNYAVVNVKWNASSACIEERQTVASATYDPIPPNAYDMDIDMVPDTARPETQWKLALPQLIYSRYGINNWYKPNWRSYSNTTNLNNPSYWACPSAARKLDANLSRTTLDTYLKNLSVAGNTYHDIGFIWGARLISPFGLFSNENATTPGGQQISRHVIFMTDGQTQTSINNYEAYGLSALDRRRTDPAALPTDTQQNNIVGDRLVAMCKRVRATPYNMTVWVIAFGTDLTPMLNNCASPGRAYKADNAAELKTTFANIAAQIAKLRMAQ